MTTRIPDSQWCFVNNEERSSSMAARIRRAIADEMEWVGEDADPFTQGAASAYQHVLSLLAQQEHRAALEPTEDYEADYQRHGPIPGIESPWKRRGRQ